MKVVFSNLLDEFSINPDIHTLRKSFLTLSLQKIIMYIHYMKIQLIHTSFLPTDNTISLYTSSREYLRKLRYPTINKMHLVCHNGRVGSICVSVTPTQPFVPSVRQQLTRITKLPSGSWNNLHILPSWESQRISSSVLLSKLDFIPPPTCSYKVKEYP